MSRRRRRTAHSTQQPERSEHPTWTTVVIVLAMFLAAVLIAKFAPAGTDPVPLGVAAFEFAKAILAAKR